MCLLHTDRGWIGGDNTCCVGCSGPCHGPAGHDHTQQVECTRLQISVAPSQRLPCSVACLRLHSDRRRAPRGTSSQIHRPYTSLVATQPLCPPYISVIARHLLHAAAINWGAHGACCCVLLHSRGVGFPRIPWKVVSWMRARGVEDLWCNRCKLWCTLVVVCVAGAATRLQKHWRLCVCEPAAADTAPRSAPAPHSGDSWLGTQLPYAGHPGEASTSSSTVMSPCAAAAHALRGMSP